MFGKQNRFLEEESPRKIEAVIKALLRISEMFLGPILGGLLSDENAPYQALGVLGA